MPDPAPPDPAQPSPAQPDPAQPRPAQRAHPAPDARHAIARLVVDDRDAMTRAGALLAALLRAGDVVVLTGALGAGKTTLARGLGEALRVRGPVTSPTFVIARVHPSLVEGPALVHVDAYRLGSIAEVDDLDLDATLETAVTVVEWGEGLVEGLSADRLEVAIRRPVGQLFAGPDGDREDEDDDVERAEPRTVTVTGVGDRWVDVTWPAPAAGAVDRPTPSTP